MDTHTVHDAETLIAMQDIRQSLAAIAKRAEQGEAFVVIRNSKPSFRIVPYASPHTPGARRGTKTLGAITAKLDASNTGKRITPRSLDQIIHEMHRTAHQ